MSDRWAVHHGDCREVMEAMELQSIDSIVSDPPYGLSFMGKGWDHGVPGVEFWQAALRVAKPGAHLLAFGGTRTFHRLTVAIEDAGWDIRDCLMWVYGSGFPKSHDVSKAIDKAAGAKREVVGLDHEWIRRVGQNHGKSGTYTDKCHGSVGPNGGKITAPATDAARQWQGWGTALKPAWEPIILARKPLSGTVAANVLEYGTGGINVDGCRVGTETTTTNGWKCGGEQVYGGGNGRCADGYKGGENQGRWPANLIHDGSDEVVGLFPQTKSGALNAGHKRGSGVSSYDGGGGIVARDYGNDSGSAARFFYCAKASKSDRDEGCEGLEERNNMRVNGPRENEEEKHATKRSNHHPTVKPTDLMRYLCRLVTPPGGLVFDPFTGSGSTGKAAMLEGLRFVGAELSEEYIEIARARIGHAAGKTRQKELALA